MRIRSKPIYEPDKHRVAYFKPLSVNIAYVVSSMEARKKKTCKMLKK